MKVMAGSIFFYLTAAGLNVYFYNTWIPTLSPRKTRGGEDGDTPGPAITPQELNGTTHDRQPKDSNIATEADKVSPDGDKAHSVSRDQSLCLDDNLGEVTEGETEEENWAGIGATALQDRSLTTSCELEQGMNPVDVVAKTGIIREPQSGKASGKKRVRFAVAKGSEVAKSEDSPKVNHNARLSKLRQKKRKLSL